MDLLSIYNLYVPDLKFFVLTALVVAFIRSTEQEAYDKLLFLRVEALKRNGIELTHPESADSCRTKMSRTAFTATLRESCPVNEILTSSFNHYGGRTCWTQVGSVHTKL